MSRPRSCYRLSDEVRAACLALLKAGTKTAREIGEELHISPASVYDVRRASGLPRAYRGGSRKRVAEPSREDLPTCRWCGLLAPCVCTGPMRAEQFMGRRDEPVCNALGW